MKRFLLAFYFMAVSVFAFSQSQPLAVEKAVWIIADIRTYISVFYINYYAYEIEGDTSINEISYKKVYKYSFQEVTVTSMPPLIITPPYPLHITPNSKHLFGLVRDYQQKVYAIRYGDLPAYPGNECPKNTEFEMFNYTWQIGDTVRLCAHDNIPGVNKVTSIVPNSPPFIRKTYTVSLSNKYYEGIGTDRGLFEKFIELVDRRLDRTILCDYCTNNLFSCGYAVNINETKKTENQISIYPNPTSNKITISTTGSPQKESLVSIYNIHGELVLSSTFVNKNTLEMDVSSLARGVYIIKIQAGAGFETEKLVIQ